MDKYIEVLEEPTYNLMINQKETIRNRSRFQSLMYSYDNNRYWKWGLPRIYKQEYSKKSYRKQNIPPKSDL